MNLAGWCVKNNRTASVAFLLIALAGVYSYFTISKLETPDFRVRVCVVSAYFPGAPPQKMEELITDKMEKKLQEMPEVKVLSSQSMGGLSIIEVEVWEKYKDLQPIWRKVRDKMEDIKPELPEGVYGPYVNDEFGDVFPIVVSLTGDGYSYREIKDAADDARDELLRVKDVAKVVLYGSQDERIFVEVSNSKLAELGISPLQLAETLKSENIMQPGGSAVVGTERIIIEATGEFKSVEQIRRVSLRVPGKNEAVYVEDIAEVRRGFVDPPSVMAHYNVRPAIMLAVSMAAGGKVTDLGDAVAEKVAELQSRMTVGLDLELFLFQPKYVSRAIDEFMSNLGDSFLYVVITVLLFCGLRMGLITGVLVPMTMLMTLALMPLFDIKLHTVSIASLIIALGMLVDNGIVTSENILVRMAGGEDRLSACMGAVRELWLPLLTSSLTTIFAFLPIPLATSDVGEYCVSLFQVVSMTLLCSWILSLTFIPLLCYYFLKPKQKKQSFEGRFYSFYRAFLVWGLKRRFLFVALTTAAFVAAIWAFRFVPNIFFPPNEREMLLVDFWLPYGTDARVTQERVAKLERFLLSDTNVVSVGSFIGEGGPRWYLSLNIEQENPNYANVIVNLRDIPSVKPLIARIRDHLSTEYPDCRFAVKELENGPPVGAPIQIRLSGRDMDALYRLRIRIGEALAGIPGVFGVYDDWGEWTKKLVVDVNQQEARMAGLTSEDVAVSLQSQVSGIQATEFREGREIIPIIVRSEDAYRNDLGRIESLHVYSYMTGKGVPLLQIASSMLEWQPSNIRRRNKTRTMTIKAEILGRFSSEVMPAVVEKVSALTQAGDWPEGYSVLFAGEQAESDDAQASMMTGLPLAMGLMILILISQFNSIRRPLIIILTIPPMLVGIVAGLLLTGEAFGFMAFLGMISLMGIIVNNAIMMIDRMEIERAAGQTLPDAIVVSAQRRFRPIMATATTTVVGLLPLALAGGAMWRPMAYTIMFGLAFATVLTLGLCPVLYAIFFRANFSGYAWNPDVLKKSSDD